VKLTYKGKYTNEDQLPKGILPSNAVKFREPGTPLKVNLVAILFMLPALLLIYLFVLASSLLHSGYSIPGSSYLLPGMALAVLAIYPHELLHAVCFGKNAEVELYIIPRLFMAFVYSTQPVSKARFIVISLFPSLVLGWLPLAIWTVLPPEAIYSNILYWFSYFSILFGAGDYLNVYNAIRQMPKGSIHQLSGFHSYWYMPMK
jgi:hypothetical protein